MILHVRLSVDSTCMLSPRSATSNLFPLTSMRYEKLSEQFLDMEWQQASWKMSPMLRSDISIFCMCINKVYSVFFFG